MRLVVQFTDEEGTAGETFRQPIPMSSREERKSKEIFIELEEQEVGYSGKGYETGKRNDKKNVVGTIGNSMVRGDAFLYEHNN
jgi:hypothetical protein